jgi:hypothetical protein
MCAVRRGELYLPDSETGNRPWAVVHTGEVGAIAIVSSASASIKTGRGTAGCAMASDPG